MRTDYRPPRPLVARINRWLARLAVLGLTPRDTVALEVAGLRTGRRYRTALVTTDYRC